MAQIQLSYKEIKSPSSCWYEAIGPLWEQLATVTQGEWKSSFKKDRSHFLWHLPPNSGEVGRLFKTTICSLLWTSDQKLSSHHCPPPTTTILFYIIIFLDHSSPPIPLFCGLSLLPSCSPCWWSGGIIGAAYWWLAACVSGQRDSCIYTSKWQTDYFIKTLSVDRFAGHEGLCELLPVFLSSRAFERS